MAVRISGCVSKTSVQYFNLIFLSSLLDDTKFASAHTTQQQLAGRQQQRKLGLTSGNMLVQKQIASDNISQSQQHPLYP